jgi:hypothetical protein
MDEEPLITSNESRLAGTEVRKVEARMNGKPVPELKFRIFALACCSFKQFLDGNTQGGKLICIYKRNSLYTIHVDSPARVEANVISIRW